MFKDKTAYGKYFSSNADNITITSSSLDSKEEREELFRGNLNTLDDWIKHEELLIKRLDKKEERDLRKDNANRAFYFSLGWACFIGFVIVCKMFCPSTYLNEVEYLSTIGALTITILTYYLVVIKSIFPNNNPSIRK